MKKLMLAGFLLFQVSAFANEVIDFSGQKLVLIKTETAETIAASISSSYSGPEIISQVKAALESELVVVPGQANYCSTAKDYYNKNGTSAQSFFNKCKKALTSRDLITELATEPVEYENVQDLRMKISAYLTFLLLM